MWAGSSFFAASTGCRLSWGAELRPRFRVRIGRRDAAAERGAQRRRRMKTLTGQLLIAMPQMMDPRFARSVVYVCAHSEEDGAMGLVVNKLLASLTMDELMGHLKLEPGDIGQSRPVYFGGP